MGVNALNQGFGRGYGAGFGSNFGSHFGSGFGGGFGRGSAGYGHGGGKGGSGSNLGVNVGVNLGGGRGQNLGLGGLGGYGGNFGGRPGHGSTNVNVNIGVQGGYGGYGGGRGSQGGVGFGGGYGGGHGGGVPGYGFGGGRGPQGGFGFGGGFGGGYGGGVPGYGFGGGRGPQGGYGGHGGFPGFGGGKGGHAPEAQWTVSDVKDGKAMINLGDRYSLALNEANSVWTLTDSKYDAQTRVWGDPHVDIGNDGKTDFDFKKDASFRLEDGTRIAVGTVPFGGGDQTMSSSLAITRGRNAIQVMGLGDKYDGANNLQIQQSRNGHQLSRAISDGAFTAQQAGRGWLIDGQPANQAIVNQKEAGRA